MGYKPCSREGGEEHQNIKLVGIQGSCNSMEVIAPLLLPTSNNNKGKKKVEPVHEAPTTIRSVED